MNESRVQIQLANNGLEKAFIEVALFPTREREDFEGLPGGGLDFTDPHQIECRERGIKMKIQGLPGTHLTILQPRELLGIAKEKFDLKACLIRLNQRSRIKLNVSGSQHDITRLGRVVTIDQDDDAQFASQTVMPQPGRVEFNLCVVEQGSDQFEAPQILPIDFALVLARTTFLPFPARRRRQKRTVGVGAQFRDELPAAARDRVDVAPFGIRAIHRQILNESRDAVALRDDLLRIKSHPRSLSRIFTSGRSLRDRTGQRIALRDVDQRAGRDFQPAFGTTRAAIEKRSQPERMLPALGDERSILRGDPDLRWRHDLLTRQRMKRHPVERRPKLPRQRPLRILAVATQIAQRDMPAQGEDRTTQNFKEPGLRLTNRWHLFEDVFDNCHGDVWYTVDFVFHSEPFHRLFCEALSSFFVRTIAITKMNFYGKLKTKQFENSLINSSSTVQEK